MSSLFRIFAATGIFFAGIVGFLVLKNYGISDLVASALTLLPAALLFAVTGTAFTFPGMSGKQGATKRMLADSTEIPIQVREVNSNGNPERVRHDQAPTNVTGAGAGVQAVRLQPATNGLEKALLRQIEELSKTDPLIGAKIGGKEIFQRLLTGMKGERGVHIDSLLVALGALAGYACQAGLRAQAVGQGIAESSVFVIAATTDGKKFFFGDHLNKPLIESQYSIWSLAGGAAQHAGCGTLVDIGELFKHVAGTVGKENFGKPRFPEGHDASDLPINYVRSLWPILLPIIQKFCPNPEHWSILLGFSIQEAIEQGKTAIDPCLALQLVMESAAPMSKIDLVPT